MLTSFIQYSIPPPRGDYTTNHHESFAQASLSPQSFYWYRTHLFSPPALPATVKQSVPSDQQKNVESPSPIVTDCTPDPCTLPDTELPNPLFYFDFPIDVPTRDAKKSAHMATRARLTWKPDSRGYYTRALGWEYSKSGKLQQHKFLLGTDRKEAERRERKLRELWETFERTCGEAKPLCTAALLIIP